MESVKTLSRSYLQKIRSQPVDGDGIINKYIGTLYIECIESRGCQMDQSNPRTVLYKSIRYVLHCQVYLCKYLQVDVKEL